MNCTFSPNDDHDSRPDADSDEPPAAGGCPRTPGLVGRSIGRRKNMVVGDVAERDEDRRLTLDTSYGKNGTPGSHAARHHGLGRRILAEWRLRRGLQDGPGLGDLALGRTAVEDEQERGHDQQNASGAHSSFLLPLAVLLIQARPPAGRLPIVPRPN